jgi:cyclase
VYTDNGRERTGLDVLEWVKRAVELGAGEVLVTAVDREGTRAGFDLELIRMVSAAVPVPVIASGGMGTLDHFVQAARTGGADGVSMADVLHYSRLSLGDIRKAALEAGLPVRRYEA